MSVELANGQQRAMVRHSNHDRLVVSVAFRPDGRLLATASSESDRTAKEWALVWRWFHERWTCDLPGDLIATGISGPCVCNLGTSNVRLLNVSERHMSAGVSLEFLHRACALVVFKLLHDPVQVAAVGSHHWVIRPQDRRINGQGPFVVGAGTGRSPRSASTGPSSFCRLATLLPFGPSAD